MNSNGNISRRSDDLLSSAAHRHHNQPPPVERLPLDDLPSVPFGQRFTCTVREASEASGLGPTMIYELFGNGALESIKVGRRRLVVVASLRKLLLGDRSTEAA